MNNNHLNNNLNASSQQWMMGSDHRQEPYNYMMSRPPGPVLPIPPQQHSHQQHSPLIIHQRQEPYGHEDQGSVSPSHEYESKSNKASRSVIPSKRAAQNRAAQKAFRQRREQYIRDLEIKSKEMEDWQNELDNLRKENKMLQEKVILLESHIKVLTENDPEKLAELEKLKLESMQLPTPKNQTIEPVLSKQTPETTHSSLIATEADNKSITSQTNNSKTSIDSRSRQESLETNQLKHIINEPETPFVPLKLSAPNDNPPEPKQRKLEHIGQVPINTVNSFSKAIIQNPNNPSLSPISIYHQHGFWDPNPNHPNPHNNISINPPEFDLDFDFDPFFEDDFGPTITNTSDYLPNANSNQVLDDLFAMLQTRQRPQIPIVPSEENPQPNDNIGRLG